MVDDLSGGVTDLSPSLPSPPPPTLHDEPAQNPAPPAHDAPVVVTEAAPPSLSPDSRPVDWSTPTAARAPQPEPLPNGGFEHSTEGWDPSNASLTLVPGVEGRAVRVTRTSTAQDFAFYAAKELVTRKAHAAYRVGAYVRSASAGMFVCLRAEEYAGGAPLTTERCVPAESGWRRLKLQGRTARKGSRLLVSIHVMAALGGTSFDVDGVRLGGKDLG